MNHNKLKPNFQMIIPALVILLFLSLIVFIHSGLLDIKAESPEASYEVEDVSQWSYHWVMSESEENIGYILSETDTSNVIWTGYGFPGKPHNPGGYRQIWIKGVLSDKEMMNTTLRFRAPQQSVELYLDGSLIYSFGSIDTANTKKTPGSIWHLVSLPSGYQGKEIYFRTYAPVVDYAGNLIEIGTAPKSTHILNIIRENLSGFLAGVALISLGLFILFIYAIGLAIIKGLIPLSLFSIMIGTWYIAEGKIPQLFMSSPVLLIYIANIAIFLMPAAFIAFTTQVITPAGSFENRLLRRLWQFYIPLTALMLLLEFFNIYSCLKMVRILHVSIIISALTVIFIVLKAAIRKNRNALIFLAGAVFFITMGLHDIYSLFYSETQNTNPLKIGHWGTLIFILSLASIIVLQMRNVVQQLQLDSKENEINYKALFKNMSEGFIHTRVLTDENGEPEDYLILEANPFFLANMNLSSDKIIGKRIGEILPQINSVFPDLYKRHQQVSDLHEQLENSNQIKLGDQWYKISSFSPKNGYESIILSDITEMKIAQDRARKQAFTDTMTGFYNRTYFEDVMSRMDRFINDLKPLSFIMIDVDGLKITNDTFGHSAGDELLRETAGIMSEALKDQGIISRIGGDEFCVIMPNIDFEAAVRIREALVDTVEVFNQKGPQIPINLSIGIATSDIYSIEDIYNIYKRADDDMYQYKMSQSGSEKSKIIDMLQIALSERDYVAQGHVERLVEMVEIISVSMDLTDIIKRNLILLAKVHDLGKIGVPDEILFKPGKLTNEEYDKMKRHVNIGFNMATRSKELVHISTLILHHHERWDGKGYPTGLKKEQIPLECRILAVLDSYDAMTSARPYSSGMPRAEALAEVERCSGTQFDPAIAEKFLSMAAENLI